MKILVTGANGYIGSKVIKQLCDFGVEVIATDFADTNIDKRAKFLKADIFSPCDDYFSFFNKPDVCLHLAWRNGFVHNADTHMVDLPKHIAFIENLIRHGLRRIAVMGTMHEIGYWEGAVDENTQCKPLTPYGEAKNELRKKVESIAAQYNCKFQWLRAFYIYGDDSFGNSIFVKIRKAASLGDKTFPFTDGKNKFDFIHIDELALQISKCLLQDKVCGIINCCSGKPISLAEKIEWYIKENKLPITLEYGKFPNRPYDSPIIYGDDTKIRKIMED